LLKHFLTLFAPYVKYWSTPKQAARVITKVLMNESGAAGVYYDDMGNPMLSSELVRDPKFTARVVSETRALLETVQTWQ
jgi:spore maturation protein SpmB